MLVLGVLLAGAGGVEQPVLPAVAPAPQLALVMFVWGVVVLILVTGLAEDWWLFRRTSRPLPAATLLRTEELLARHTVLFRNLQPSAHRPEEWPAARVPALSLVSRHRTPGLRRDRP